MIHAVINVKLESIIASGLNYLLQYFSLVNAECNFIILSYYVQ